MLATFQGNLQYWAATFTLVLGIMTIAEILWGRDQLTIAERLKGLPFWGVQIVVRSAVMLVTLDLAKSVGVKPVIDPFPPGIGVIAGTIIVLLCFDLGFYTFHRIQHRFLWRLHAPHHSFTALTAINSYHHWTDPILSAVLFSIPLSLIAWPSNHTPALLVALTTLQAYGIHSNLRFDLGPFKRVLVGPAFHRIHHSLEPAHIDKNFGAFIPLWDWLFGTLVWPTADRPAVGVADFPEPSFRSWWLAPWRSAGQQASEAEAAYPMISIANHE